MSTRRRSFVCAAVMFLFAWTLTTHGKYSASGDEPHYLMITHSLVVDHDLDLANNYANNDGRFFGHRDLIAGPHVAHTRSGSLESVHDIGLAVFLTPAYFAARAVADRTSEQLLGRFRMDRGLFTYSMVSLTIIAMTSIAIGLLAHALETFTGLPGAAYLALALGISPPIVSHSFLVFPESLALTVTSLVVWMSLEQPSSRDPRRFVLLCLALGLLPWAHRKYTPYVLGLLVFASWYRRDTIVKQLTRQQRFLAMIAVALPQVVFYAWSWHRWGTVAGPQIAQTWLFSLDAFKTGVFGLWLDRQSGVVAYAPIYWVLPLAFAATWRRTWPAIVPIACLYVPMAAFLEWWAGFAPAARYLVPVMPLCAMPMADAMRHRPLRIATVVLLVPQIIIDAAIWQHPRGLWPAGTLNPMLESLGKLGKSYESLLPALRRAP